jgi:NADPH:quinone reductase-like Zn-dependent oxidoreductase
MSLCAQALPSLRSGFTGRGQLVVARRCRPAVRCTTSAALGTVLVAGATGGVGQRVVARLLQEGYSVRAIVRCADKARALFGEGTANLEVLEADLRESFCDPLVKTCSGGSEPVAPSFCLSGGEC